MEWLYLIRTEPLTYFFQAITFLGNSSFLLIFLPILYWCWRKRTAFNLFILVILAAYLNSLLKNLFGWERPPMDLWLIDAGGFTFPSTHAVLAATMWGFIALEVRKKWFSTLCIIIIILIAFSRVYLGVHYLRDVIVGLVFGTTLLFGFRWISRYTQARLFKMNDFVKSVGLIVFSMILLFINPSSRTAVVTGLLAGVSTGFFVEPHFADFAVEGEWWKKLLRIFVGILILLAIQEGLNWTLPDITTFKWFEFFILGLWMTAVSPWIFLQLRLAKREV